MSVLKNKKITVMGLGLHGGGAAVVAWLVKQGAVVTVTDLKTKTALQASIKQLAHLKINWVLDRHRASDFTTADMVVQNPGVPSNSTFLQLARRAGVPVENDASLFFKHCPGTIIGVTGTRGKSTTATLIHTFLKKSQLGGLSQQPIMSLAGRVKKNNKVVLELSSWQLEVLGDHQLSPRIAVVTNMYPDHLNRYSGMAAYIAAKKQIYLHQQPSDIVVLNKDNPATVAMGREVVSQRFWFSKKYFSDHQGSFIKNGAMVFRLAGKEIKLLTVADIKLRGEHNVENMLAAVTVAAILKVNPSQIKKVAQTFFGLPGRLESLGKIRGIEYINDTTSTMPDATLAALGQYHDKKTVLIAGGDFKNIPDRKYAELAQLIKQRCKAVVVFSGRGSQQLLKSLKFSPLVTGVTTMTEAVSIADSFAKLGDRILLSPACASFNLFNNEFDRGDQFVASATELKKSRRL